MLLEEDVLFFNRHSPQMVWLKHLHNLWQVVSSQKSRKDKLCLHGGDSTGGFLVLTITSKTEEKMPTCSRKFRSCISHVASTIIK